MIRDYSTDSNKDQDSDKKKNNFDEEERKDAFVISFSNQPNESNKSNGFIPFEGQCYHERKDSSLHLFEKSYNLNNYGACYYQEEPIDNYLSVDKADLKDKIVTVADIVGSFGWFQFLILLFSGLRECSVGYDAVIMSVILKPIENFHCADHIKPGFILNSYADNTEQFNETHQCFQHIDGHMLRDSLTKEPIPCQSWVFEEENSLIADWLLVCHRHWIVAFIESAYFMGLMIGNLVWGYYADKVGRRKAYLTAHTINLVFGLLSIFVPHLWMFAICRFFSAFGAISYNIIYSIQIEVIGTKHRSYSTLLNHLGWGLGVIMVPVASRCFPDYRYMIALAPMVSLVMYPWAYWLPESSRWLMAQERFSEANEELIRAAKFNNRKITPLIEKRLSHLRVKIKNELVKQSENSSFNNKHLYRMLFTNPVLIRDTLILSYISFSGHLYYYMLTINFGYIKNLSMDANFISSGAGEWISVCVGAILLKFTSRKTSLSLFLFIMAASFIFQFLIDLELTPSLETELIISLNNAIGTTSALLIVFVALIVNQEVFPTVIRQTGSSIVNTVSESGSTLAPMLIQFSRIIGPASSDLLYATASLFGIICVQFLTKTDDIDLPDT